LRAKVPQQATEASSRGRRRHPPSVSNGWRVEGNTRRGYGLGPASRGTTHLTGRRRTSTGRGSLGDVTGCCAKSGYDRLFDERQAQRDANRYRRKGLDPAARWIVDVVRGQGIDGAHVLEPGGGVGAIQVEMLKSGAQRSTVVELSDRYDDEATRLARDAGVEARIHRRLGDFSSIDVEPADVVVMHRVVCCYPDYEQLLRAASDRARRLLVFTYPPPHLGFRLFVAMANLWMRLRRNPFRVFAHRAAALRDAVRRRGFELVAERRRGLWKGMAFVRQ
jgi:16S rRNA G966 N2-methylase RsmD